jgi:Uma2 family endonuclease
MLGVRQQDGYRRRDSVTLTSTPVRIVRDARAHFAGGKRTMHMAVQTHRWTRRDLDRLPDDGNKYEVVGGELFVTPPPSPGHEEIVAILARDLGAYVHVHQIGQLRFPRSVVVVDDSQVEPDLMVRPIVPPPAPAWEVAPLPLLVIEVLSDSTRRRDLVAKRAFYIEGGVAEYWMVDGRKRTITVARPGLSDVAVTDLLRWHPSSATAPFDLDVAAMFRQALG